MLTDRALVKLAVVSSSPFRSVIANTDSGTTQVCCQYATLTVPPPDMNVPPV